MTEAERTELEQLKQRHTRLEEELKLLAGHLALLENKFRAQSEEVKPQRPPAPSIPIAPPPIPPVIATKVGGLESERREQTPRPPSPPVDALIAARERVTAESIPVPPPLPPSPTRGAGIPPVTSRGPGPVPGKASFEMRLGTYWLVRVGIIMVLTGLVFFGNLAYHNFISKLGPSGKVFLLYLASGALLSAGWWWQRQSVRESLKNYARVLFAGGLAAVYFTTYAAHHIDHLRIISSAGWDGGLLLLWAAFMVWIADRKQSEVLALFAVLLAYYTSIITRVGLFTLYSNVILTAAGVFFLLRNRWAAVSLASLVGTYAAYFFWRFFNGSEWHWPSTDGGLWLLWRGNCFLICYWLLFTGAVFLSKAEKFAGQNRAGFLTANNGAFFSLFLLTMWQVHLGGFWKFCLIYGAALLVLAELARRFLLAEPLAKNSYLTQGLLLVTVGFIAKFSGMQLALVLAFESAVLLMLGQQRKNLILLTGAYLAAALAVGWGINGMEQFDRPGFYLGAGLGALMLWNMLSVHRQGSAQDQQRLLRPGVSYFAVLTLVSWLIATYDNTSREHFPVVLAAEALVLTFSFYLLRVRELTLLSQGFLVLAQLAWAGHVVLLSRPSSLPWWNPALMILITLCMSHWWQRQRILQLRSDFGLFCQGIYALAIIGFLYLWLNPKVDAPQWLALTSLLAVGLTVYGVSMRAWLLAAFGQIFTLISAAQFVFQISQGKPHWHLALAPIAALGILSIGTVKWFERKPDATGRVGAPLLQLALLYRWSGVLMSIWWVCEYIPARERMWLLALLGLWAFLLGGMLRSQEALLVSAAYTGTALVLFWLKLIEDTVYWPNLVVILILLGQRQLARRLPERYPLQQEVHGLIIVTGGLSLWLFLSRWVLENASGFYLTASWSVFALVLFTTGIVLRERVYRWLGLSVLACALGRVIVIDVWKLETAYRVLSFMALGIVLLVLGFIYNKYQEKIREWL